MKAMILAAGLGKRMQPLTLTTPKPLLKVADQYLIAFHLEKLAKAGFTEVVVNTHWLASQLPEALGDGRKWGLTIHYSYEPILLETAGGIRQALPVLLDDDCEDFLLINGDIYFEWDLAAWLQKAKLEMNDASAYLALVANPPHHVQGDFSLNQQSGFLVLDDSTQANTFTYSGIGVYKTSFFSGLAEGYCPLGPVLKEAINSQSIKGSVQPEFWLDVGTIERLNELRQRLS